MECSGSHKAVYFKLFSRRLGLLQTMWPLNEMFLRHEKSLIYEVKPCSFSLLQPCLLWHDQTFVVANVRKPYIKIFLSDWHLCIRVLTLPTCATLTGVRLASDDKATDLTMVRNSWKSNLSFPELPLLASVAV